MPRPEPDRLTDDWLVELGSSMIDPDVKLCETQCLIHVWITPNFPIPGLENEKI